MYSNYLGNDKIIQDFGPGPNQIEETYSMVFTNVREPVDLGDEFYQLLKVTPN